MLVTLVFNGERREYICIQVNGFGAGVGRLEIAFEDRTILSLPWEDVSQFSVQEYVQAERDPVDEYMEDMEAPAYEPATDRRLTDEQWKAGVEGAAREALEREDLTD